MRLDQLAIDIEKERDGVWIRYPGSELELLTARAWNPDFEAEFSRLVRERGGADLSDEDQEEILYQCTVRHSFKDWRSVDGSDVEDAEGNAQPYSAEFGAALFRKPEYGHLFRFWSTVAMNRDHYLAASVEKSGKKSRTSTTGSASSRLGKDSSSNGVEKTETLAS